MGPGRHRLIPIAGGLRRLDRFPSTSEADVLELVVRQADGACTAGNTVASQRISTQEAAA
jgi:hypothetical protein